MAADATDPLEAAGAELEAERLRTLLPDDVTTMEGLLQVGTAGWQRNVPSTANGQAGSTSSAGRAAAGGAMGAVWPL